jgi:hypothetical protein
MMSPAASIVAALRTRWECCRQRFPHDPGEGRADQLVLLLPGFDLGAIGRREGKTAQHVRPTIALEPIVDEAVQVRLGKGAGLHHCTTRR